MFSLIIGGGALLGHLYLYRLVRQVAPNRAWRRGLGAFLLVVTVLVLLRGPIRDIGPEVERLYEVVAFSWMGFALCMVVAQAAGDVVRLAFALGERLSGTRRASDTVEAAALDADLPAREPPDLGRRRFVTRALPSVVLAGGTLTAGYGSLRAFTPPEITEVAVPLPRLSRQLDGLTIVQLTDIHVGSFIGRSFVDALVTEVNALRPDVIAITGDLVDADSRTLGDAVAGLGRLRSRFGTFFVTGNHEYYAGVEEWTGLLERLGVSVLRNRRVPIGDAGASLDLVGVDDWYGARRRGGRGYDLDAALADRDEDRAAVLLAHQPVNFEAAVERGVGLQISGHTHGGQIFPFTELVGLGYRYNRGLYRHDDAHIYVSRGCGFWGPPARVGSAPEIVKLALTA